MPPGEEAELDITEELADQDRARFRPELFAPTLPYGFGSEVVTGLRRHGAPYKGLLSLLDVSELSADATNPYFVEIQGLPRAALRRGARLCARRASTSWPDWPRSTVPTRQLVARERRSPSR